MYTDFEDELGAEIEVELPGFATAGDFERFREGGRFFASTRTHAVRKLNERRSDAG